MARAATRQVEIAIVTAWHTAVFALNGYGGKLKGMTLSDFLPSKRASVTPEDEERHQNAQIIHFFQSLKARGADVEIERVVH